jgi:DNA replication protein DnaC
MKTIETIKCACGESFQWENDHTEWAELYRPTLCDTCEERRQAEHTAEQQRLKIENAREKALYELPALFHATDTAHPRFNSQAWNKLKDHKLTAEHPWLGLIGETGLCKTRIASLIFIEEAGRIAEKWEGNDWRRREPILVFVTGYRICELAGIVQTGSFDQKEDARKELDRIQDCDLLLIDDLGKGRITETVAATLFAIVDHRYANLLRTIWTANSTPEQIAATMNSDMAAPFAGRLNDHSKIFTLKSRP